YGMLTEQSIGKLLIAGIIPGIMLTFFFMLTIIISISFQPHLASKGESVPRKEKLKSTSSVIWIAIVFLVAIGGLYTGWFTPTEAAGVGAFFTFLISLVRRKLSWKKLLTSLQRTLITTGFIFSIVLGSFLLNYLLVITRLPMSLANFLTSTGLSSLTILILIILMYVFLGCVMESLSMIVVTIPVILPIIESFGYDLVWFGIIVVLVVELALISPPIGLNLFILKGVVPDLDMKYIYIGAL